MQGCVGVMVALGDSVVFLYFFLYSSNILQHVTVIIGGK